MTETERDWTPLRIAGTQARTSCWPIILRFDFGLSLISVKNIFGRKFFAGENWESDQNETSLKSNRNWVLATRIFLKFIKFETVKSKQTSFLRRTLEFRAIDSVEETSKSLRNSNSFRNFYFFIESDCVPLSMRAKLNL